MTTEAEPVSTGTPLEAVACSPGVIDIAAELETLVDPLAGSTQGAAVKFVIRLLREQPGLFSRISKLEENLRGWRSVAGHYCTCLGKVPHCKPCILETQYREVMNLANDKDQATRGV